MQPKQILKEIVNELGLVVHNVNFINSGGCGIFAEHFYYTLSKAGLKPTIVVIGRGEQQIKEALQNNGKHYDIHFSHIMLYVDGVYLDSHGVHIKLHSQWSNHAVVTGMPIDLLKEWNQDAGSWNPTFDRNQIKYIEGGFKKIEKKVLKDLVV